MSGARHVLIAGAGLAGTRCAESLRAEGFAGRVTVAGDEPHPPYRRPAVSKGLLDGSDGPASVDLRPTEGWRELAIDLRCGVGVVRTDRRRRVAELTDGSHCAWDALVIATGARPVPLPVLAPRPGVHRLRTVRDAIRLRAAMGPGVRLAVVGGGFVGAEAADAATRLGCEVTMVEALPTPLARAVGPEVGDLLASRWRRSGVDLRVGRRVVSTDRAGRTLVLDDGSLLTVDAVVESAGVAPALPPGLGAGLRTAPDGRLLADRVGRTSSLHVYACGDVASTWSERYGRHLPGRHWTGAAEQGAAVARAILGLPVLPQGLPYFWSDQFGLRLQQLGDIADAHHVDIDGSDEAFVARYSDRRGALCAALAANRSDLLPGLRAELAESAVAYDPVA